jgi:hypothetical protein
MEEPILNLEKDAYAVMMKICPDDFERCSVKIKQFLCPIRRTPEQVLEGELPAHRSVYLSVTGISSTQSLAFTLSGVTRNLQGKST